MIEDAERRKMLAVPMCGPRVISRLESIGVRRLADLRDRDPHDVMTEVNLEAGRPIWRPPMATLALANLIDAAAGERRHPKPTTKSSSAPRLRLTASVDISTPRMMPPRAVPWTRPRHESSAVMGEGRRTRVLLAHGFDTLAGHAVEHAPAIALGARLRYRIRREAITGRSRLALLLCAEFDHVRLPCRRFCFQLPGITTGGSSSESNGGTTASDS